MFANIDLVMAHGTAAQRDRESQQVSLFGGVDESTRHTPKLGSYSDWSKLEKLEHEFTAIGFYLSAHPLSGYLSAIDALGVTPSNQLAEKLSEKYRSVKLAGIVTGRKFKVSDKGRFAFVQLSDMAGLFEISVFNEELLSQQRDNLENGNILLITADGKSEEGGVRLIAQSLMPLDEALVKQQLKRGGGQFKIVINQPSALSSLHSLLGSPNQYGALVKLMAQIDATLTEIELPGKYALSPSTLDKIRVIKGVVAAEEIAA